MTSLNVLNAPWAILPARLEQLHEIYAAHARGEGVDLSAIEAKLGRPLANERRPYRVRDGVAVLSVDGVIAKKMNLFSAISGGTSSQLIAQDLREALADESVHSIILATDSPGGTVDGTEALSAIVHAARGQKRIVAHADGMMASAAYWIGSAAESIYAADVTTQVGSIGVVAKHVDVSGAEAKDGVKTTEITAGKYKRAASQYGPLTDAGREVIQTQVDYIYSLFVEAVARNRDTSVENVLDRMADGRVFTGRQAVAAGLVDGIASLDELVAQINTERTKRRPSRTAAGATMPQTKEQILADSPDAAKELIAQGATAERARIQAIESATLAGHEALVAGMKFDGKSTGGDVALAIVVAEKKVRETAAQDLRDEAPGVVRTRSSKDVDTGRGGNEPMSRAELAAKAQVYASTHKVTFVEAVKAVEAGRS